MGLNTPEVLADNAWDEDKVCSVSELETTWQGDSFLTSFKPSPKSINHNVTGRRERTKLLSLINQEPVSTPSATSDLNQLQSDTQTNPKPRHLTSSKHWIMGALHSYEVLCCVTFSWKDEKWTFFIYFLVEDTTLCPQPSWNGSLFPCWHLRTVWWSPGWQTGRATCVSSVTSCIHTGEWKFWPSGSGWRYRNFNWAQLSITPNRTCCCDSRCFKDLLFALRSPRLDSLCFHWIQIIRSHMKCWCWADIAPLQKTPQGAKWLTSLCVRLFKFIQIKLILRLVSPLSALQRRRRFLWRISV